MKSWRTIVRRLWFAAFTCVSLLSLLLFLGFATLWSWGEDFLLWRDWPSMPHWDLLGFRTTYFRDYGTGWIIPGWFLCLVTGALPAIWIRLSWKRRVRASRQLRGLCIACGYDLRATPEECPECGKEKPMVHE